MKEPLFHIVKRDGVIWWKAWLIRLGAIAAALILSSILTVLLTGMNPLSVWSALISGAVGTARRRWMLAQGTAILLCIALAVTPAFKMRFWNVGGEGQILMGAWAAAACMITLTDKGRDMKNGAGRVPAEMRQCMPADFTPEDARTLYALLYKLLGD